MLNGVILTVTVGLAVVTVVVSVLWRRAVAEQRRLVGERSVLTGERDGAIQRSAVLESQAVLEKEIAVLQTRLAGSTDLAVILDLDVEKQRLLVEQGQAKATLPRLPLRVCIRAHNNGCSRLASKKGRRRRMERARMRLTYNPPLPFSLSFHGTELFPNATMGCSFAPAVNGWLVR